MRVAVCISGQPRNYIEGLKCLKERLLDKYNCDIFIHTWYDEEHINKPFNSTYNNYQQYQTLNANAINEIIDIYQPKKILSEKYKTFDHPVNPFIYGDPSGNFNVNNVISMFYSMYTANQLKTTYEIENDFTYDVVIRWRFDLATTEINLNEYELNSINIPNNVYSYIVNSYSKQFDTIYQNVVPERHNCIFDLLAFSTSENMNKYANTYANLGNIRDVKFIGECLLHQNIKYHQLNVNNDNELFAVVMR